MVEKGMTHIEHADAYFASNNATSLTRNTAHASATWGTAVFLLSAWLRPA